MACLERKVLPRVVTLKVPIFQQLGIWVWDTDMQSIEATVLRAKQFRYKWIAVKAQDGTSSYRLSTQKLDEWRHACQTHGITFGLWGFLYGHDAILEAHLANDLVRGHGAKFYIADAESGYESNIQASQDFASAFRFRDPKLPAALSSFGRVDLHRLDWHSWARHGFSFMPQAYFNESPMLHPVSCIQEARKIWPVSQINITFEAQHGWGYGHDTHLASRQGVRGFNFWRADIVSDKMLTEVRKNK